VTPSGKGVFLFPSRFTGDGGTVHVDSAKPLELGGHLREAYAQLAAVRFDTRPASAGPRA